MGVRVRVTVGSGVVVGVRVGVGPEDVVVLAAKVRALVGTNILIISECNGGRYL